MKPQACCFFGASPRLIHYGYDEQHPNSRRLKMLLAAEIEMMNKRGINTFLTGMMQGPDMWGAEIVLGLKKKYGNEKISLTAYLPYEDQATQWRVDNRERYFDILSSVDDVFTLQTRFSPDCMHNHKRCLIDASSHLIAVHDVGKEKSYYMINYAIQKGLHIISIHPESLENHQTPGFNY